MALLSLVGGGGITSARETSPARLLGDWSENEAGDCETGTSWRFARNGRFHDSQDTSGQWTLTGDVLMLDGSVVGGFSFHDRYRVVVADHRRLVARRIDGGADVFRLWRCRR